jgi:hypothetical protein
VVKQQPNSVKQRYNRGRRSIVVKKQSNRGQTAVK